HQKAEGERARGHAALPAELVEDRREEQREGGPRVDADGHGDEGHGHDQPAVEEGQSHRTRSHGTRFSGVSPRPTRSTFSAMSFARASSIPSVQPDTCGVMSTFGSSWNGRRAGRVGPISVGYRYQTSSAAAAIRRAARAS